MVHISYKVSYSAASSRFTVSLPYKEGRFRVPRDFSMNHSDQIKDIARRELKLENFIVAEWGSDYFIVRM